MAKFHDSVTPTQMVKQWFWEIAKIFWLKLVYSESQTYRLPKEKLQEKIKRSKQKHVVFHVDNFARVIWHQNTKLTWVMNWVSSTFSVPSWAESNKFEQNRFFRDFLSNHREKNKFTSSLSMSISFSSSLMLASSPFAISCPSWLEHVSEYDAEFTGLTTANHDTNSASGHKLTAQSPLMGFWERFWTKNI